MWIISPCNARWKINSRALGKHWEKLLINCVRDLTVDLNISLLSRAQINLVVGERSVLAQVLSAAIIIYNATQTNKSRRRRMPYLNVSPVTFHVLLYRNQCADYSILPFRHAPWQEFQVSALTERFTCDTGGVFIFLLNIKIILHSC